SYGIEYDDQPVSVRLPTPPAQAVAVGMVEWDLGSDRWSGPAACRSAQLSSSTSASDASPVSTSR
ncbi:hypothetical protein, partial [Streptomyces sp. S-9]|uniref:hypothetical protein n=1 Tax=Streptomyces sp. S-9 TaxID=2806600 RepID=UPI001EF01038